MKMITARERILY